MFDVHGLSLQVAGDCPSLVDSADELLEHFRSQERSGERPRLRLVLHRVGDVEGLPHPPRPPAEVLFEDQLIDEDGSGSWTFTALRDGQRIVVELGPSVVEIVPASDCATVWVAEPDALAPEARESLIYIALSELLRHNGIYSIHAAGLEREGHGLLLPATRGSGKTTSLLALMQAGWRLLSDDHPLFRETTEGIQLLPFPTPIAIRKDALERFAWLPRDGLREGATKHFVAGRRPGGPPIGSPCSPSLVLFPEIVGRPHSSVMEISGSRALEEIVRHSLVMLDPAVAVEQFRALGQLVRRASCYRLALGSDVGELGRVVDSMLTAAA